MSSDHGIREPLIVGARQPLEGSPATHSNHTETFGIASFFSWLLLYKLTLEVAYPVSVTNHYTYFGLVLDPEPEMAVLVLFLHFVLVWASPRDKRRPSTYLFLLLQLFVFIPALSFSWLAGESPAYTTALFASGLVIALLLRGVRPQSPSMPAKPEALNRGAVATVALVFIGYVGGAVLIIVSRGGIDPRALNFQEVYGLRAENTLGGFLGYWYNWCAKAFFPFFLGYFLTRRRSKTWRMMAAALVVTLQLGFYLSFGFKAYLFSIAFALIVAVGIHTRRFVATVVGGVSTLAVASLAATAVPALTVIRDTVLVRTLFIPAQIQFQYFEWFSQNDFLYFSETLFGRLLGIESPYPEGISFRIGSMYSDQVAGVNANTGVFADGYANGGVPVMLLTAAALGAMLILIDYVSKPGSLLLTIVSFSYFTFTLNDTPLSTALLTGGYLVILGLLQLTRRSSA